MLRVSVWASLLLLLCGCKKSGSEKDPAGKSNSEKTVVDCYPGDGRCGTLPRFVVGCAYRECLLGRWTFVCEDKGQLRTCEGTRLSDNSSWEETRCASACGEDGKEVLDCDFYWPERRRARLQREAEQRRPRIPGPTTDAGPAP